MNSPGQNVVSLRDGRAVIGVAARRGVAMPDLVQLRQGSGRRGEGALSATANPEGWETELRRVRHAGHIMPVEFDGRPAGLTAWCCWAPATRNTEPSGWAVSPGG